MAKPRADEVEEQLKKQAEFYGDDDEDLASGSDPEKWASKGTEEMVEDVVGHKPSSHKGKKGFTMADEVDESERAELPGHEEEEPDGDEDLSEDEE